MGAKGPTFDPERVAELGGDAVDAEEEEGGDGGDGDAPEAEPVDELGRDGGDVEREHLLQAALPTSSVTSGERGEGRGDGLDA